MDLKCLETVTVFNISDRYGEWRHCRLYLHPAVGLLTSFPVDRDHDRKVSSGMLHRVALVRTDVSEEPGAFIRVTRIGELGTTQAATSNRRTLRRNTITRATRRNIPKDTFLHSHRRENLKSYRDHDSFPNRSKSMSSCHG
jgi:hypothetical protein